MIFNFVPELFWSFFLFNKFSTSFLKLLVYTHPLQTAVAKSERNLLRTNTYLHGKSCKSSRVVLPDARCARFELFFVSIGATDSCFGRRAIGRTAARHGPLPPGGENRKTRLQTSLRGEDDAIPRCGTAFQVRRLPGRQFCPALARARCLSVSRASAPSASGSTGQQTACEGGTVPRTPLQVTAVYK